MGMVKRLTKGRKVDCVCRASMETELTWLSLQLLRYTVSFQEYGNVFKMWVVLRSPGGGGGLGPFDFQMVHGTKIWMDIEDQVDFEAAV
ncbi:hypothetical protein GBA52_005895 [Prunus armeniaca]|nr:hypothetical protein GBA52_005895 [Prunus armeniaca]